jgi:hypothetical protein
MLFDAQLGLLKFNNRYSAQTLRTHRTLLCSRIEARILYHIAGFFGSHTSIPFHYHKFCKHQSTDCIVDSLQSSGPGYHISYKRTAFTYTILLCVRCCTTLYSSSIWYKVFWLWHLLGSRVDFVYKIHQSGKPSRAPSYPRPWNQ